jgi:hypothetical protein
MEAPPHPMRLGDDEKDYYRLGAAGVEATGRAPGLAGPGGPSGAAVFAGAPGAPATFGVQEVDPGVADDAAGEPAPPPGAGSSMMPAPGDGKADGKKAGK